jgi:DNA-directed RNA polymerase
MPNIIHSLDCSFLVLLLHKYFNEFKANQKNIYCVHDCFAVTANNMDYIVNTLKIVYISLYSDKGYLLKYNSDLIKHIKNHIGDAFLEEELIIEISTEKDHSKHRKIKYPDINKVLKKTFDRTTIKNSSYILN